MTVQLNEKFFSRRSYTRRYEHLAGEKLEAYYLPSTKEYALLIDNLIVAYAAADEVRVL